MPENESNQKRVFIPSDMTSSESERAIVFVLSTNDVASDQGIVLTAGGDFSQWLRNPVFLWSHDHRRPAIGGGMWIKKDPKIAPVNIIVKDRFAKTDDGEQFRILYRDRILTAVSLGWANVDISAPTEDELQANKNWRGNVDWVARKWIMREHSGCNIPALDQALAIHGAMEKGLVTREFVRSYFGEDVMNTRPAGEFGWDETDSSFRYRIRPPEDFEEGSFRTKTIHANEPIIKAVFGKLRDGGDAMVMQSLIFTKGKDGEAGWTKPGAAQWLEEHKDSIEKHGGHAEFDCEVRTEIPDPLNHPDTEPIRDDLAQRAIDNLALPEPSKIIVPEIRIMPEVKTISEIRRGVQLAFAQRKSQLGLDALAVEWSHATGRPIKEHDTSTISPMRR